MRAALIVALIGAASTANAAIILQKSVIGTPVQGGRITYRVNIDRTTEGGVVLIDAALPNHTLLTLSSGGFTVDCTMSTGGPLNAANTIMATCNAGNVQVTIADIPTVPPTVPAIDLTYRLNAAASSNTATVNCNTPASCPKSVTTPATVGVAPVTLAKTVSSPQVVPGAQFTYTITVTQNATTDVVGFVVRDTLPAGVTCQSVDQPVASTVSIVGSNVVLTNTAPFSPATAYPYVLHCTLDSAAPANTLVNTATVTAPGGTAVSSPPASFDVTPTGAPLSFAKSASGKTAKIGDAISFTLTTTPNGPQPGSMEIHDQLDPGLRLDSVTIAGQQLLCNASPTALPSGNGTLHCSGRDFYIDIPTGQSLTAPLGARLNVTVLPTAPPSLTNTATLTDSTGKVYQSSATVTISGASNGPSLVVTAGKVTAEKGDLVPFAVAIGNPSSAPPLGKPVLFLQTTPGLRVGDVRIIASDGTVTIAKPSELNNTLQLPLPVLPAGTVVRAEVRARVSPRAQPGAKETLSAQLSQAGQFLAGAAATVRILEDAEFDLATIVGEVYRDDNKNGERDRGEPGIPGALVVMDDGLQAVTDAAGRFHLAAVRTGERAIKVAQHTLPPGSTIVSEETQVLTVTPGIMLKTSWAVHVPELTPPPPRAVDDPQAPMPQLKRDGQGLSYVLVGQAAGGARVLVCTPPPENKPAPTWPCKPATVDKRGGWQISTTLLRGRNRFAVVTAWPDGRLAVGARDVYWVDRGKSGFLVLPRPEENRLTLGFPAGALVEPSFTLEGITGAAPLSDLTVAGQKLVPDARGKVSLRIRLSGVGAAIPVEAKFADGMAVRFDHVQEANGDYLLLVGLAEGKLGYVLRDGAAGQSGILAEGRVKLYVKGRIQGRWLIEGGLDIDSTQISSWRDIFRGDPAKIFRNLDPDRFYTVYGDASQTTQAAQSRARLYVRIDVEGAELLFGNMQTGLTGVEMGRYSRAVTGGRVSYARGYETLPNGKQGKPSTQIIVFGAWLQTARGHDELRGTGGSLYYLSHRSIVEGSEQVRIELRDRISDRPMGNTAQHGTADYEIDYFAGRLTLRQPLSSIAATNNAVRSGILDGDRAWLIVDYEYLVDQDIDDAVAGGRATQKLGPVRLGGTVVNEFRTGAANYTLLGGDVQIDLKRWGVIIAEYAHSYGSLSTLRTSNDGGLTYNALGVNQENPGSRQGNAWKVEADLHFGCKPNQIVCVTVRPYARGVDQGYTDTAHAQDTGYLQWGAEIEAAIWRFRLTAHYDERRYTQNTYDASGDIVKDTGGNPIATHRTQRDIGGEIGGVFGRVTFKVGVRSERADDDNVTLAGNRSAVGARIDVRIVPKLTLYGSGQYSFEHTGQGLTGVDNSLAALGAIAQLPWDIKLQAEASGGVQGFGGLLSLRTELGPGRVIYGTVTLSQDRDDKLSSTVAAGGRERITDKTGNTRAILFAEDQFRDGPVETGGRAHILATGVDLPLAKRFVIGATFERGEVTPSAPVDGQMPLQRTAGTLQASYAGDKFRLQLKGEVRNDVLTTPGSSLVPVPTVKNELQWLVNGMVTWQVHPDITLRAKVFVSRSSTVGDDSTLARSTEITGGLAWRPSFTDRFSLLLRYTWLDEFSPVAQAQNGPVDPVTGVPLGLREQAHVMSLAAEGRVFWRISIGGKIAAKWRLEPTLGAQAWYILWISRISLQLHERLAAVVEYRVMPVVGVSIQHGAAIEANVRFARHARIGVGWNFSNFSDNELVLGRGTENGFFVRAEGFY
jgi:uncharacterized repeat protein (TIGR01451 family)/fimbrial isopeptide formation D2 family protein